MRPVTVEHVVSQYFAQMPTAGVRGDIKAVGTVAYYVALYGNYQPHGHAGMDFKCPIGTPIYAMADGTVLYAGWSEDLPGTGDVRKWLLYYNFGGIITVIQHAGWVSITAHQSTNDAVHVGMKVKRGQLIGKSGDTKTRTTKVAPHVHVEALVDLSYKTGGGLIYGRTDPARFFTAGGLAAQGTTTPPQEDDDMAYTPEEMRGFAKAGFDAWAKEQREFPDGRNLIDHLIQTRTEVGDAARAAKAIPATVLYDERVDGRNLFDWLKQLRADVVGIKPGSVDVAGLAKALAEQLPTADAEALVDALAARLGGK